jgi:hypothetical protein
MPPNDGQPPVATMSSATELCISSKSTHVAAAAPFLNFAASPAAAQIAVNLGTDPMLAPSVTLPGSNPEFADEVTNARLVAAHNSSVPYLDWATPTLLNTLSVQMQNLLAGKTTVSKVIGAMETDYARFRATLSKSRGLGEQNERVGGARRRVDWGASDEGASDEGRRCLQGAPPTCAGNTVSVTLIRGASRERRAERPPALRGRRTRAGSARRPWLGLAYLAPGLVLYILVVLVPTGQGVWLSLFHWNGVAPATWAGLSNYTGFLTDPTLRQAVTHTLQFIVFFSLLPIACCSTPSVRAHPARSTSPTCTGRTSPRRGPRPGSAST